jgi:hypothetical protein
VGVELSPVLHVAAIAQEASMTFSYSSRRRRVTVAVTVSVLATMAVAGRVQAGVDDESPVPIEMVGRPGLVGSDLGQRVDRRGPDAVDSSGGFVYRHGDYVALGTIAEAAAIGGIAGFPGATVAQTHFAINNRGETAGHYIDTVGDDGTAPPGSYHGFVESRRGDVTTFDVPGAASLIVQGNNDHGDVVGEYIDFGAQPDADGLLPANTVHAFVRQRDGRITTVDLPYLYLHNVSDINNRGQIVGYYDDPNRPYHLGGGFLRQPDGAIVNIDVPGALSTAPRCINDRGQVVGSYIDAGAAPNPDGTIPQGVIHGFIWDDGRHTTFDAAG